MNMPIADLEAGGDTEVVSEAADNLPQTKQRSSLMRWATHTIIVAYLTCLGHGIVCHALQFRANAHPLMYFTVWDMFCGWSGWSFRTHVVAEGQSGQLYELTPTPWGEFHPYSDLSREHYDSFHNHAWRVGINCLKQTDHEPMTRMYLIEETWSKKYNLPDELWAQVDEEPRESRHYFHVDAVYQPDGTLVQQNSTFHDQHRASWLASSLRGHSDRNRQQILTGPLLSN